MRDNSFLTKAFKKLHYFSFFFFFSKLADNLYFHFVDYRRIKLLKVILIKSSEPMRRAGAPTQVSWTFSWRWFACIALQATGFIHIH